MIEPHGHLSDHQIRGHQNPHDDPSSQHVGGPKNPVTEKVSQLNEASGPADQIPAPYKASLETLHVPESMMPEKEPDPNFFPYSSDLKEAEAKLRFTLLNKSHFETNNLSNQDTKKDFVQQIERFINNHLSKYDNAWAKIKLFFFPSFRKQKEASLANIKKLEHTIAHLNPSKESNPTDFTLTVPLPNSPPTNWMKFAKNFRSAYQNDFQMETILQGIDRLAKTQTASPFEKLAALSEVKLAIKEYNSHLGPNQKAVESLSEGLKLEEQLKTINEEIEALHLATIIGSPGKRDPFLPATLKKPLTVMTSDGKEHTIKKGTEVAYRKPGQKGARLAEDQGKAEVRVKVPQEPGSHASTGEVVIVKVDRRLIEKDTKFTSFRVITEEQIPLFGENGPNAEDIKQTFIGDCYLLASLGALARQNPSAISEMIKDYGDYVMVRFFVPNAKGILDPVWIQVDKSLVCNKKGGRFVVQNASKSLWPAMVEKGFALLQSDQHLLQIVGSGERHVWKILTGQEPFLKPTFMQPLGLEIFSACAYDSYFDRSGNGVFRLFSDKLEKASDLDHHPILSQLSERGKVNWVKFFTPEKTSMITRRFRYLVRHEPGYISRGEWGSIFSEADIPPEDQNVIFKGMRHQMILELQENGFFSTALSQESIEKLADYLRDHIEERSNFNKFLKQLELANLNMKNWSSDLLEDKKRELTQDYLSLLKNAGVSDNEQKGSQEILEAFGDRDRLTEILVKKRCASRFIGTWNTKKELQPPKNDKSGKSSSEPIKNPGAGLEDVNTVPGLAGSHAYEIVGTKEKSGETYVRIRNPWGNHGAAYDKDGNMSLDPEAGEFDLKINDFIQYGHDTTWRLPFDSSKVQKDQA